MLENSVVDELQAPQLKVMYAELVESHVQMVNDIDTRLALWENGL